MLIVPDIHGREFWREPLEKYPNEEVIFLGDYLDPYPEEGITPETALHVFQDILKLKRDNPDRITLLLGNHDLGYLDPIHKRNICRHDWKHDSEITWHFLEAIRKNPKSFRLSKVVNGEILFSHAGFHPWWIKNHPEFGDSIETVVDYLENKLWSPEVMNALCEYSGFRGGYERNYGSPVWSDLREWCLPDVSPEEGITQIFGHTQLKEGKIIEMPGLKCVDCKHVVKLKTDNTIEIL